MPRPTVIHEGVALSTQAEARTRASPHRDPSGRFLAGSPKRVNCPIGKMPDCTCVWRLEGEHPSASSDETSMRSEPCQQGSAGRDGLEKGSFRSKVIDTWLLLDWGFQLHYTDRPYRRVVLPRYMITHGEKIHTIIHERAELWRVHLVRPGPDVGLKLLPPALQVWTRSVDGFDMPRRVVHATFF
jgi:hypothetical protein